MDNLQVILGLIVFVLVANYYIKTRLLASEDCEAKKPIRRTKVRSFVSTRNMTVKS